MLFKVKKVVRRKILNHHKERAYVEDEILNSRYVHRIWPKKTDPDFTWIRYASEYDSTKTTDYEVRNNFYELCRKLNI